MRTHVVKVRPLLLVGLTAVVVVAVGGLATGHADAGNDNTETDRNVDLLAKARKRTVEHDYSGVILVRWRDAGGADHQSQTLVRYDKGVVEIGGNGHVVTADPNGLVLDGAPRADDKYDVTSTTGPEVAGQPTTLLEARRDRDGMLVERFYVDNRTGLVLRRESFDRGTLRRSLLFTHLWPNADRAGLSAKPVTPTTSQARLLSGVASPYRAPINAGDGFRLIARWRRPGSVVQLSFSDGLTSASVFEQVGRLNWDQLPAGGVASDVDGHPAFSYSLPVGDVLVWERAGIVYTCVGDVPAQELLGLAAGVSRRAHDGTVTRLARVVLAPFAW